MNIADSWTKFYLEICEKLINNGGKVAHSMEIQYGTLT